MKIKTIVSSVTENRLSEIIQAINLIEANNIALDSSVRIHFLSNYTINGIEPFLKFHLYKSYIEPDITFGSFNIIHKEFLDPSSKVNSNPPDIIVISLFLDNLAPDHKLPEWGNHEVITEIKNIFDLAKTRTNTLIAINTLIPPFYSELGISTLNGRLGLIEKVTEINHMIRQYAKEHSQRFFLLDWERFTRILGEDQSIDYRYWHIANAPFRQDFLNLYAKEISRIAIALKGKSKKCLVVDCDNTLWGGIVGEDGLDGLDLNPISYPGSAYYEFHILLLNLAKRGILIALCSKNNEDDVWEVLDNHPHCLLKREHLSAWKINWKNKTENLSRLAEELNIGMDSMVVVDDNPVECDMIQQMLPDISVIQVPSQIYKLSHAILRSGYFDTLSISDEDVHRTKMYQTETLRNVAKAQFDNVDQYLRSLNTVAYIRNVEPKDIPRIAQLTQKTNQFNLTTKRLSNSNIESIVANKDMAIYCVSISDKFGDSGLTGVFFAEKKGNNATITNLILSCRILGRDIEIIFTDYCMRDLEKKWEINSWEALYVPSSKNQQVSNFWEKMGFHKNSETESEIRYSLNEIKEIDKNIDWINVREK